MTNPALYILSNHHSLLHVTQPTYSRPTSRKIIIWTKLLASTNISVWRTRLWYRAAKHEDSYFHMVPLSVLQIQVMHESNSLFVEYFEFMWRKYKKKVPISILQEQHREINMQI